MSVMSSSRAALLIVGALRSEAARSGGHRRLYLGEHVGVSPKDIFQALMATEPQMEVSISRVQGGPLRALAFDRHQPAPVQGQGVTGRVLLIPYLVTGADESGQNRGSEGYAALLRSRFKDDAPAGEVRVFLVLHEDPVETIKTAAEDASELAALSWRQLCEAAVALCPPESPSAALLAAVTSDLADSREGSYTLLENLAEYAARHWSSAAEAGGALWKVGAYVSDPQWEQSDLGRRLKDSRRWRQDLDRLSEPGNDLEKSLRRKLGESPVIDTIKDAFGPGGLDYSRFSLEQLEAGTRRGLPSFRRVLRGPQAAMSCTNGIAAWFTPSGAELVMRVSGRLAGIGAEITWIDGQTLQGTPHLERQEVAFEIPGRETGWRFGSMSLHRGPRRVVEWALAAYFAEGSWFPVEGNLNINVEQEAFVVEDEATAYLVSSPRNLGRIEVDIAGLEPGSRHEVDVRRNLESHGLPIYLVGAGPEPPEGGPEPPEGGPEPPDDGIPGGPEEEDGGPRPGRVSSAVRSPVHAMFRAKSGDLLISERGDPPSPQLEMVVATEPYHLEKVEILGIGALDLEGEILSFPEIWTHVLTGAEGQVLQPDPRLERLPMESVGALELAAFKAARASFFSALTPFGSAYAAGDPAVRHAALDYVRSYAGLLHSLPERQRGNLEFDRCLLIDSIGVPGGDVRIVAPTNPLSVAFYLTFWDAARKWSPSEAMLEEDLRSISPMGLLPLLSADGDWYEATSQPGLLWKVYQRTDEALPAQTYSARFIAKKLKFFLTVHPTYRDPRQTLAICVFEPGDGQALIDALRLFYYEDLKLEVGYALPKLNLRLITPRGVTPTAVNELLAAGQGRAIDRLVRSRVQVSVKEADPSDPLNGMPDFSHITFIHRTNTTRRPGPVELGERASSRYVGGLAALPGRLTRKRGIEIEFFWGAFGQQVAGELDLEGQAELNHIVTRSLEVVGSQNREMLQPNVTRMLTATISSGFIEEVYERSIWVIHLERLLGLEIFAPDPGRPQRYLIDYDESLASQGAVDGITATEYVTPYHNAVRQALLGFDISAGAIDTLLNRLNAVAGNWALQLLHSSPQDILEKVGVATATAIIHDLDRSFDRKGGIGVLLSMEELLDVMPAALPRPESAKSDDLLFLWTPFEEVPAIRARVIEVKFASTGAADLTRARQQLTNTCGWLESTFAGRPPAVLFRARDLAELIRAAVARNSTFRLAPARRDNSQFETALDAVASGKFTIAACFWLGAQKHRGDVIAVELESTSGAVRTAGLPGLGEPFGLIRVGRMGVADLADGRPITADGDWVPASFDGPEAASQPASPIIPNTPDAPQGAAGPYPPAATDLSSQSVPHAPSPAPPEVGDEVRRVAKELDAAVIKYGLELEPFRPQMAQIGPSVIRFRSKPLGKQALDGIVRRAADLGREVGASEGVLVSQEPYYITIDVPRRERQVVYFSDHMDALAAAQGPGALNFLLGIAPSGKVDVEDIARLPHLLIAGATGSGKSILLRSILCSLLLQHPPEELRILLVDPKQIDFIPFEEDPHLVNGQIVSDPQQAIADLEENIEVELARRRPILRRSGASNALEFYEAGGSRQELPQMVIIVDEFADLASALDRNGRTAFMSIIQRYGQLTRAYGIYLVLATQRPSVQVITGDIKANMTARVALKLLAPQDSMTILGHSGAESLRDKGDLIFEHAGRRERLQGFFVRPRDITLAVNRWRPKGGDHKSS